MELVCVYGQWRPAVAIVRYVCPGETQHVARSASDARRPAENERRSQTTEPRPERAVRDVRDRRDFGTADARYDGYTEDATGHDGHRTWFMKPDGVQEAERRASMLSPQRCNGRGDERSESQTGATCEMDSRAVDERDRAWRRITQGEDVELTTLRETGGEESDCRGRDRTVESETGDKQRDFHGISPGSEM